MYGVVAGHMRGGGGGGEKDAPSNEQVLEERVAASKKRGFTARLVQYVKNTLNPQPEQQCGGSPPPAARHRPHAVAALAHNTRFTPHEIKLMYRGFKQECPTGVVDEDAFKHIFSQFFPLGDASQYAHYVFNTVKHKQSGKLDFEEFLEILSRVARGSVQDKLAWVFSLYDVDGDGRISRHEMEQVVGAIYELVGRAATPPVPAAAAAAKEHVDRIFNLMDADADGSVSPDELARWVTRDPHALRSLHTLDTVL